MKKTLEQVRAEFVGKEMTWGRLDNEILDFLDLTSRQGVFEDNPYDYADGFCYQTNDLDDDFEGFNFVWEIVESNDEDALTDVIVKVLSVEEI